MKSYGKDLQYIRNIREALCGLTDKDSVVTHWNVHFEAYVRHGTPTPEAMYSNWSSLNFYFTSIVGYF